MFNEIEISGQIRENIKHICTTGHKKVFTSIASPRTSHEHIYITSTIIIQTTSKSYFKEYERSFEKEVHI